MFFNFTYCSLMFFKLIVLILLFLAIFLTYLLYKAVVSLCVSVCTPCFPTRPSDRNKIWHTYSDRYGTGSNLTKIGPTYGPEGWAHWDQSPKWDLGGVSRWHEYTIVTQYNASMLWVTHCLNPEAVHFSCALEQCYLAGGRREGPSLYCNVSQCVSQCIV